MSATGRGAVRLNKAGKRGTDASAYVWLVWDKMSIGKAAWL